MTRWSVVLVALVSVAACSAPATVQPPSSLEPELDGAASTPTLALTQTPAPPASPTPTPAATPTSGATPTPIAPRVPGGSPTGFQVMDDPKFISANHATYLDDSSLVLGYLGHGEARAYPISMMWFHHIVNDTVGGSPLLVTY